jgi:flagellin
MTVTSIASIAAGLARGAGDAPAKPNELLSGLFAKESPRARSEGGDVASLLSSKIEAAQFRIAAQNISQTATVLAAADSGAQEISAQVDALRALAVRAGRSDVSNEERGVLDQQFQNIRQRIDRIAQDTRFNNEALLGGAQATAGKRELTIGSLTSDALFDGKRPSIATQSGAASAAVLLNEATSYVATQRQTIAALQSGLEVTAGTLESAIANQEAAGSIFDDADVARVLVGAEPQTIGDFSRSVFAQTNRLPANLIKLLNGE